MNSNHHFFLSDREFHTVLAALRLYQRHLEFGSCITENLDPDFAINDIATNLGEVEGLHFNEIDPLCARLCSSETTESINLDGIEFYRASSSKPLTEHETLLILNSLRAFQKTRVVVDPSAHLTATANAKEIDAVCDKINRNGLSFSKKHLRPDR